MRSYAATGLDTIRGIVPFQPTTDRTFSASETLRVFARVSRATGLTLPSERISVVGPGAPPAQLIVITGRRGSSGTATASDGTPFAHVARPCGIPRVEATQPGAETLRARGAV